MGSDPALLPPPATGRQARRTGWYVSVAAVVAAAAVILPAVVTWSGDRAELHGNTDATKAQAMILADHDKRLAAVEREAAAAKATQEATVERLRRIESLLDAVARATGATR